MPKTVNISINAEGEIQVDVKDIPLDYTEKPTINIVRLGAPENDAARKAESEMTVTKMPTAEDLTQTATHKLAAGTPPGTYEVTVVCSNQTFTDTIVVSNNNKITDPGNKGRAMRKK